MPTGYTAPVIDGEITTAQEFAYECSKAFVWSFREGNQLTYPVVDDYYQKSLDESMAELAAWDALNEEGRYAKWSDAVIVMETRREEARKESEEAFKRLFKVRTEVEKIRVPETHANFKKFMIEQLNETIKYEGTFKEEYYQMPTYPEWADAQRGYILRSVEHAAKRMQEIEQNVAESRQWISTLAKLYNLEVVDR